MTRTCSTLGCDEPLAPNNKSGTCTRHMRIERYADDVIAFADADHGDDLAWGYANDVSPAAIDMPQTWLK